MTELLKEKHINFLLKLLNDPDAYERVLTLPKLTNSYYWGLSALYLLGAMDQINTEEIVEYMVKVQTEEGGFGGNLGHDAHIHQTLSAIQTLVLLDRVDRIDKEKVVRWIQSLQKEDGSFMGDKWGEVDTRFSYCAIATLSLLGRLDAINVEKAVEWIKSCQNIDGGFGVVPGCESHAGQVFVAVAALALVDAIESINKDSLGFWLSERQSPKGGFNGRPEKLPDVCYTWWVGSPISIIGKEKWVDVDKLEAFVLASQDAQDGGIADRPGNMADPFHTFLGIAGLTLFGKLPDIPKVDPRYALPAEVIERHFRSNY